ncbi:MAG: sigma 54-interacting transcriptional regulator [Pirellulales bacterium]
MTTLEGVSAAAIVQSDPPHWNAVATAGTTASKVPTDLAAETLDSERPVRRKDWVAVPLYSNAGHLSAALLLQTRLDESLVAVFGDVVGRCEQLINERCVGQRQAERFAALLNMTHQWHQSSDMETLLVAMAEAATRLFHADRASIFLWDRANRTLVGRPALGIEGGELRIPDDAGVVGQVVQSGVARRVDVNHDPQEIDRAVDQRTGYRTQSLLCVPLLAPSGERLGAFELLNKQKGVFSSEDERGLADVARYAAIALQNTQQLETLLQRQEQLVEQAAEGVQLVGQAPAIVALRSTVARVANTDLAILVLGENGTGKEIVAQSLHYFSRRRKEPFVAVNCAALAETLLESELFGHEKGAFTDARETRAGKFEIAAGGTLFLDEIGDMSLGGQAKLLRVLEEKTIVRVGGNTPIHTEVRIVAATNRDLATLVRERRFREDLYYRLNVVSLELPPLRERGDDVLILAQHFLQQFCRKMGRKQPALTAAAKKRLIAHLWPGNVRELRNLIERLVYLTAGDKIDAADLSFILAPQSERPDAVELGQALQEATQQFQRDYIHRTIGRLRGNVSEAATALGVHRSNLYRKMRQLGMEASEE